MIIQHRDSIDVLKDLLLLAVSVATAEGCCLRLRAHHKITLKIKTSSGSSESWVIHMEIKGEDFFK